MADVIDVVKASWSELEEYIGCCKNNDYYFFERTLAQNPVLPGSFEKLVNQGWNVKFREMNHYGITLLCSKEIFLRQDLQNNGYERDKTIFHEFAHVFYDISSSGTSLRRDDAIMEWLGRQWRANPLLLRHGILAFGLEPKIYDKASYLAFRKQEQLEFPFFKEQYDSIGAFLN